MAEWVDVAPVNELAPGSRKVISTEIGPIAVFNLDGLAYPACLCGQAARRQAVKKKKSLNRGGR